MDVRKTVWTIIMHQWVNWCVCVCEHGLTVNCRIGQGGKTRWPSICLHGYFVYFSAIANPSNALPLSITLSKTIQDCIHLPVSFKYQLENVMVPTYLDTGQIWVGHVGQLQSYIVFWCDFPILFRDMQVGPLPPIKVPIPCAKTQRSDQQVLATTCGSQQGLYHRNHSWRFNQPKVTPQDYPLVI